MAALVVLAQHQAAAAAAVVDQLELDHLEQVEQALLGA